MNLLQVLQGIGGQLGMHQTQRPEVGLPQLANRTPLPQLGPREPMRAFAGAGAAPHRPATWEDNSGVNLGSMPRSQLNLGVPSVQSNPQGGFGLQVQNVGGYQPQLQAPITHWQNTDGVRRNMINPQVQDDGYYYF